MTYIIMPLDEVTPAQLKVCVQPNLAKCRKISSNRVILKYEGIHPILFWGYPSYNQEQMCDIMRDEDLGL